MIIKLSKKTPFLSLKNDISLNKNTYVVFKGCMFFLNFYKFEEILTIMNCNKEFYDFLYKTNENNITEWLRNKKILTEEILEEISYYKLNLECFSAKNYNKIMTNINNDIFNPCYN